MADAHNHMDKLHGATDAVETQSATKALSIAFWLNLVFSIVEVAGGLLINSTAVIADALHDFMDAGAIGLAILLERISAKKRTSRYSYGFKRFSLLSALGLSLFLLTGAIIMIATAYKTFITPREVHSIGMLGLAVLGIAVNGFAFLNIKHNKTQHNHSHGGHNSNSKSIMLHLLEDVLGWAAVLIGAVIIHFTGWNWIDGVLAIGIALFVGYNALKNLVHIAKVMLQSVPENVNLQQLQIELKQIEGISDIHDVHVWSLDGNYNVGSLHAVVNTTAIKSEQDVMSAICNLMKKHNIQHPTVQIESGDNSCELQNC